MNPWLIGLILLIATFFGGMGYGSHNAHIAAEAQAGRVAIIAKAAYDAKVITLNNVSSQLEETKRIREALTHELDKQAAIVKERPVYQSACFDTDGLHILNDAILKRSPNTGQFALPLPRSGTHP